MRWVGGLLGRGLARSILVVALVVVSAATAGVVVAAPGGQAPRASFEATPNPAQTGETVTFNAAGSTDPGGSIVRYEWDLDGNGSFETDGGTDPTVSRAYSNNGTVTVKLRVTDDDGNTGEAVKNVTITNRGPTASFTATPAPASTGQEVMFDAGASQDPDGSIATYEWDLDGNGTFETNSGTDPTVSRTYSTAGTVNVKLQVTDDDGATSQAAKDITITSTNRAPSASFTAAPNPALTGQAVSFDAGASQDPDGSIAKYEWDLDGNGSFETNSGTAATVSRAYSTAGTVNVKLRVTDNAGGTAERTLAVRIDNRPPTATFSFQPENPVRQQPVTFDASRSTDPDGTLAESDFRWDLDNDGAFDDATGRRPSHTFATSGPKTVSLRVTDSHGAADTETRTLTVQEAAPTATFGWSPTSPLSGQTVTFTSSSTPHPGMPIASQKWDLDNDGQFDDGTGTSVSRSFPTFGSKTVRLEVIDVAGGRDVEARTITVNARPRAAFTYQPRAPQAGQELALTSVSLDPDGPIAGYAWDLDNDGQFDDGSGVTVSHVFWNPGTHTIRLRVRDTKGATATTSAAITVAAAAQPPPQLVSPFPVVRILGRLVRGGARIRRLSVRAPAQTTITVRCRGRRCPYRRASAPARPGRSVRFRRLERRLRAGTLVEILVSHPTKIGKYTGFRIRRGRSPRRKDLCLAPGARRGSECPSG